MPQLTDVDVPFIDLFDPDAVATMAERTAAWFADGVWLVRTPLGWSIIDYEAVRELQHHPALHTPGVRMLEMQGVTEGRLHETTSRVILSLEGEEHTRIRRLVSRAFTPRAVDRLRPLMRAQVEARVASVEGRGRCELMADIARSYPIAVICELVGAPKADWPLFSAWADQVFRQFNFNLANDLADIESAGDEMEAYVGELIEARRRAPGDDLLSELIAVEEEGDRLSRRELVDLVMALLLAGTDTTRNQLGLAVLAFCRHPDQWARLAADPGLVRGAVDEVLRFDPTAAATPRVVVDELDFRGVTFPVGTFVSLVVSTANRDPSQVACPEAFDIAADRGGWSHLAFGSGPHYCLGANLARAELQEALAVLPGRMPNLRLDGVPEMKPVVGIYGPRTLPIAWDPA